MKYRFINYQAKYKEETTKMLVDFHKYLIKIDTWRIFKLDKDYGEKQLEALTKSVKENKGKGKFILVKSGQEIIGYVVGYVLQDKKSLETYPWKRGYIDELYIKEKYRKMGIGKELLSTMINHFKSKNCDTIGFNAMIANKNAIAFYEKMGFERRSLFLAKALNKKVKK